MPSFLKPYTAKLEEGFSHGLGAVLGVAGAVTLPKFLPSWNTGWWSLLLSLGATAATSTLASRFLGSKQGLGAAIGGVIVTFVKAIAMFTDPTSKVRELVGIGLSDLNGYAGMGDMIDPDLIVESDDISEFTDSGSSYSPEAIGMDDLVEASSVGMHDLVELDSF